MPDYIYAGNNDRNDKTNTISAAANSFSIGQWGCLQVSEFDALVGRFNLTAVINEIQTLTMSGSPTGGTFTLAFGGQITTGIPFNATALQVQNALVALSSIGQYGMTVFGPAGGPWACWFDYKLGAAGPQPLLVVNNAGLTGGTTPAVGVVETQAGVIPAASTSGGGSGSVVFATLTGKISDDTFAISAGTGVKLTVGGGDAAVLALSLQKASNLSDLASAATAKTNLALVKADVGLGSVDNTSDASKPVSTAQATAIATRAQGLIRTSVKTSAYTAAPGDAVPVDISGGSVPITLPPAPVNTSRILVKVVAVSGTPGSTSCTLTCGGTDVFNVAAGSTVLTATADKQGWLVQYDAGIWTVQATDTPLGVALGAAKLGSDGTVGGPSGSALTSSVANGSALGITAIQPNARGLLDDTADLRFNLANSGAVGGVGSASTTAMDHTALIQAYVNACSAAATAVGPMAVAAIDCPNRFYRVQNLASPANVKLRCNGTRFGYVHQSLNAPTGPGNYVIRCFGSYNAIEGAYICGNGVAQPWVGGVWLMPAGAAGVGSARSYQTHIEMCSFDQLGGRAVYDQGVGNHIRIRLAQNCMLSATSIGHFMGAVEQAGTDGWVTEGEFGPSNATTTPRCPVTYDGNAITTTNGTITLPLVNATVVLVAAPASGASGGTVIIGGHVITYTGVSGVSITGANCADSGAIASGTNVYIALGFVAAFSVGGSNNWSRESVCEFGDVGIHIGNSTKAHVTVGATLTTVGVGLQPITVDNACHLLTAGGTLGIPMMAATVVSFPAFTYTSISESTLSAGVTLNQTPQNVVIASTTGWPASGMFNAAGYTVTYTSVVDGVTLGGCTIASGSATLASGLYVRSNTLNGCAVASGTLVIAANQAVSETSGASRVRMTGNRADFPRSHGWVITSGSGSVTASGVIGGPSMGTNTYDAFHNVVGSSASVVFNVPWESTPTGSMRFARMILDAATSASSFNKWLKPDRGSSFRVALIANGAAAAVEFAEGVSVALAVNSATPTVDGLTNVSCANTGVTTITNFTTGVNGQRLTAYQDANTTIGNGASIVTKSGANITPPASGFAALQFRLKDAVWYQV